MSDHANPSLTSAAAAPRSEARRLLVLAAPIIAAMVSRMAMGFVDFVMVSRLGTEATAAISPASFLVFGVLCLGMGAVMSVQTFASQALGRGQPHEASAYAWQSFYLAAAFFALTPAAVAWAEPFWTLVGHDPAVRQMETDYCRIGFWCMGFAVVCGGLESFFNGVQKPSVTLKAILVALGFNVAANYCLIFGKFGFPTMGIRGAAIATVIAWGVRAAMLTAVFLSREFRETYGTTAAWRLDFAKLRGVLTLGGPIAVQWVLDIGAWFAFITLLMGGLGTATLAATNITIQLMHASFMPAIGLGTALCSLVGHAIGAREPDLAVRRVRTAMALTGGYMGAIGLVFLLARYPLMRLLSDDPTVIAVGAGILIWTALFQVSDAVCITYINALRGAGDTRRPAVLVILHVWVLFVGGGYLATRLLPQIGYHGPWMMCTAYIMLLGLVLWRRFARGAWREIRLFEEQAAGGAFPVIEADEATGQALSAPAAIEAPGERIGMGA